MRSPLISPVLRERRTVIALLHRIDKPDITYAELESVAEELLVAGGQAASVLIQEITKTEDLDRLNKLTFLAAYLDDERMIEALSRLLYHPQRSRAYKAQILQTLDRLGVDTESRRYQALLRQREALHLNLSELRRCLPTRPEAAIQFLYDCFYATPGRRRTIAQVLLEEGDVVSLQLLAYLAEFSDESLWPAIVAALARRREGTAADCLLGISRFAVQPALAAEAAKALRKLRFAGVPSAPPIPAREDVLAWAGPVEGNGTQMVWLAAPRSEQGMVDTACFLLHQGRGLLDCFGEVGVRVDEFVRTSVQGAESLGGRSVPLAYALALIEESLALAQRHALPTPPELPFRLRTVGVRQLCPHERSVIDTARPRDANARVEWAALCKLWDQPILDDWVIHEPAFFHAVSVFYAQPRIERRDVDRFVTRVYGEFVLPERPFMQRCLLRNAEWIETSAGDSELAKSLRIASATLEKPHPAANPFVYCFILKSIREARELLREGFDPSFAIDDEFS